MVSAEANEKPNGNTSRRFSKASDATKELYEGYNAWTGGISKLALQSVFAIIAANWAVHGHAGILGSVFAKLSIALALAYLAILLGCALLLVRDYGQRFKYAEADRMRWLSEFEREERQSTEWPYTRRIERIGGFLSGSAFAVPITSGACFLLSLWGKGIGGVHSGAIGTEVAIDSSHTATFSTFSTDPTSLAMWAGLILLLCGAGVILFGCKHKLWQAALVSSVGLLMFTTGAVVRVNLSNKIDFNFVPEVLIKLVQRTVLQLSPSGPERLAVLSGFVLGDDSRLQGSNRIVVGLDDSSEIDKVAKTWLARKAEDRDGLLMIVGSADRLRLNGPLGMQFDANVGLAQARGEAVKGAILRRCRALSADCNLSAERMLVLVAGPRETGAVSSGSLPPDGYPQDRRVEIWAFWNRQAQPVLAE